MVAFAGPGPYIPVIPTMTLTPSIVSPGAIVATGDKISVNGRVWYPGTEASKNITRVGFRFGAITKAGGSALTVSLQNVDAANGPPMRPDGTPDQSVAVANAAITANTWLRTNALSAVRAVAKGELLSVVVEYDGAGRLGADSITLSGLNVGSAAQMPANHQGVVTTFLASVWATQLMIPNIILEFDDGTFGTFEGAFPTSGINSHAANVNTAVIDEYALAFQVPYEVTIDGLWATINPAASAEFEMILYADTVALQTVAVDAQQIASTGSRTLYVPIPVTTLTPGVQYYVSVRPTLTNTVTVFSVDVDNADHWTTISGGPDFTSSGRLNQGAWGNIPTTRRLLAGVRLTSVFF